MVVERIAVKIALFGMGVRWEELDPIGPFRLPADPRRVEEATVEWTPKQGGHRCVRASIHVRDLSDPLLVARNLHVVQAAAYEDEWRVPFRLGNPERERAPIMLRLDERGATDVLEADVHVGRRVVPADQPVWLRPGEEVDAELRLRAPAGQALEAIRAVEAYIAGHFIDGIQVTVHRPAMAALARQPWAPPQFALAERQAEMARVG
jgi:hypothetical protein